MRTCIKCEKKITKWSKTGYCRSCVPRQPRITDEERIARKGYVKQYKAKYFQANKERILKARKKPTKEKTRSYGFMYNYGISLLDYSHMLELQNNCCAICQRQHLENNQVTKLHVDHCHKTEKIRGLLCTNCNKGLSHFCDSLELLNKAIIYLNEKNTSDS